MSFILIIIKFVINRIKISSWLLVQQKKKINLSSYLFLQLFISSKQILLSKLSFIYVQTISRSKIHD